MNYQAQHGGDAFEVSKLTGLPLNEILDFSLNVNPYGPPKAAFKAMRAEMYKINYYPSRSYVELRRAIAAYLTSFNAYAQAAPDQSGKAGIDENNIVVGCGGTELIHSFLARFVRGGTVAIPLPTFSEYEAAASALNLRCVKVNPKGLRVDLDSIAMQLKTGDIKCAIICNPNNPTGELLNADSLSKLLDLAEDRESYIMLDEAYLDLSSFGLGESLLPKVEGHRNLIVLRSLTKLFGFPGLRVGYAVCNRELAKAFESTAISWRVGVLEERAATAALGVKDYVESSRKRINREKSLLVREIGRINYLKVEKSNANFLLVGVSATGISPANLKWRLLSHGVLVRELSGMPGLDSDYIRICVRGRKENGILVKALRNILSSVPKIGNFSEEPKCECRPCHFKDQDCRICFCPFYPCLDGITGGKFVDSETGGKVWSCNDCHWIHEAENAARVIGELERSGVNILSSDPAEILGVRKRCLLNLSEARLI